MFPFFTSLRRFGTHNDELIVNPADTHGLESDLTSGSTFGPEVHRTGQGHHGLVHGDADLAAPPCVSVFDARKSLIRRSIAASVYQSERTVILLIML